LKKELLLIIGPFLLLTGCGKKNPSLSKPYTYEKKEAEVLFTEFDDNEENGSVRSFFDDNDYYAQSDFESTNTFFALGDLYDDAPLSETTDALDEEEDSRMALDTDYELENATEI
jgi:hypothetical protein